MKYKKVLDRRTFLRGAGGAIVGLPFLDEMLVQSVYAAEPEPPVRAFNVFFGLGFNRSFQTQGYQAPNGWCNPLEPLLAFEKKLAFLRGVNQIRSDGTSNAHYDGSSGAFTGTGMKNFNTTGGASIDEALRRHAHPNGMPNGMIQSLSAGTFWRRSDSTCRYIHSRAPNGSIVSSPYETPRTLFNAVFGSGLPSGNQMPSNPEEARTYAMKNSVLDSVVDQYQHYKSDAGGLGLTSRAKISDHLDHVRALEIAVSENVPRMGGGGGSTCAAPNMPSNSKLPHNGEGPGSGDGSVLTNDGSGIDITVAELTGEFRLMADLYSMAIACDRARFGSLVFQSGGERIRLKGDYSYNNFKYTFADQQRHGAGGSAGCSHEWWHKFSDTGENPDMRAHVHLMMREIGYFFKLLDSIKDANGGSVLDNALLTVSTESADGRHRTADFELNGVFHAISGGNGRLKVGNGNYISVNDHASKIYNTMLKTYGVPSTGLLGDQQGGIASIVA
ncbi:MAG: DUF1552 domain-containing protein [Marinagarivorans sp.]|nr:DUF1552 domain-containing protein [Marinagarivorans sp.]